VPAIILADRPFATAVPLRCAALAVGLLLLSSSLTGQTVSKASASASNPQLVSPAVESRVEALLKRMTLEEKIGQLVQYNDAGYATPTPTSENKSNVIGANPPVNYRVDSMKLAATGRLGSMLNTIGKERTNRLQRAAVEQSRLHIPILFGADIIHGFRTVYPVPLGLAAMWDPPMVTKLARISADEATTAGIRWFYSPMVDISRDARWGRSKEGAGEDPYLGAAMARAYVAGYQNGDLSRPDSVAACVKHFAAYGAAEAGREYNTTDMSMSRLHQVYLPPYKAAVQAGAATIMSSFNALNGVPATANPYLLQTVLRDRWGFDGFVVSDYTAVMELMNHGIALDPAEATRKAITAGVDVDMMSHFYDAELPGLVRSGKIPMDVVDEAVRRVLRVKFALGLFDQPYAESAEVTSPVLNHRAMVRQAAEESLVLLQNHAAGSGAPLLPLAPSIKKIALIGPLADDAGDMVDLMNASRHNPSVVTLKDALESRARQTGGTVIYAPGTEIQGASESGFAEAEDAAWRADVVIMALGESSAMSGEAGSRAFLNLPGNQQKLVEAITATGKPVVLVVFSGRPLVLTWAVRHVAAILEAWFPGTEAGNAIVNVLFGDVSPSGKLPMSFPRAVGQEPLYYNQFPTGRPPFNADLSQPPGPDTRFISRYIDVPNDALFPFGFGLTYSRFDYSGVKVSRATVPLKDAADSKDARILTVSGTVKNVGDRDATDVVQLYLRTEGASLEQPVRSLKGFRRVTLKPGESVSVSFDLGFNELSYFDNEGRSIIEPTRDTVWIGGSSTATASAQFQIIR
jgi:beta-glucosidase